jgi:hypothetical protein
MTKRTNRWNIILAGVAGGMLSLGGIAFSSPANTETEVNTAAGQTRTQLVQGTATVTGVDRAAHIATIKTEDGEETSVQVPAGVRAFDTMKVGDKVDVAYHRSFAVSMGAAGSKPNMSEYQERQVDVGGGVKGREISVSAEVVNVNPRENNVTFKGPKGYLKTIHVEDAALRAKLPSLRPGQVVRFDYINAVATSIRPTAQ